MARKRVITRTIESTKYEVMALNVETAEVLKLEFCTSEKAETEEKMLKKLQRIVKESEIKLVKILESETIEQLYEMSEEDFISYATPIDHR